MSRKGFQPGHTGRPRGTRNKLAGRVFEDILAHWCEPVAPGSNVRKGQEAAGSPQIYATFQRDNLRRHFGVRVLSRQSRSLRFAHMMDGWEEQIKSPSPMRGKIIERPGVEIPPYRYQRVRYLALVAGRMAATSLDRAAPPLSEAL